MAADPERPSSRSSLLTTAAVAITAYALCDLVHEMAGHGFATLMVPGVRALSLSSVALQTTGDSRIVAAAGSIANVLIGALAIANFHHRSRFSPSAYFVWLFGSVNLLNGAGYPLYSAVLGFGDWEVVVRGLQPSWMWRAALGIAGAAAYTAVVFVSAHELARAVRRNLVSRKEIPRLVFSAYVAGGALLLVASVFNPISPSLILASGAGSGFAAMAGLTLVPMMVENRTLDWGPEGGIVQHEMGWVVTGTVVGILFVAVVGPGVRL